MCHTTPKNLKALLQPFNIQCHDCWFTGLSIDSREIRSGMVFLAYKGEQSDGRDFISQAFAQGAVAVLQQTENSDQHGEITKVDEKPVVHFFDLPKAISSIGHQFYQQPSEKLTVVGVTGTNGKSTTTHLVAQLTNLLGKQGAVIGTLGAGLLSNLKDTVNTTPDALSIHSTLADMVHNHADWVAMEVSSHGLVQGRVDDVHMNVAVFTNLTRDHLDYHHTMDEYAKAKRQLLNQPGLTSAVINGDDPEHLNWLAELPPSVEPVLYGFKNLALLDAGHRFCCAEAIQVTSSGFRFKLLTSWGEEQVHLPLLGEFNISNSLAALGALLSQGVPFQSLMRCIGKVESVPGRMELFVSQQQNKSVIVDYAHTPDGLAQALDGARKHGKGQIWCVFGCGGDRDKGKRSMMGKIAQQLADHVILTNDNPRSENEMSIVEDILCGIEAPEHVTVVLDRRDAIRRAFENSHVGDVILVAGKGHETVQIIKNNNINYDERLFIQRLIEGSTQCSKQH